MRASPTPVPAEKIGDDVIDVDPSEEVLDTTYTMTSYGADFLVDGLVARLRSSDIIIPRFNPETEGETGIPGFQRNFVWRKSQCDKFIESLLMGFPVPGIFLVQQPNNILLVLDGQQRLVTLEAFYSGQFKNTPFRLNYVSNFNGYAYHELPPEDRRRLDNSIVHATIIKQDDLSHHRQIYNLFERINTGGTPLQPQEIRIALYDGPLIKLVRSLNANEDWRNLFGTDESPRFKDHELILRFLAFYECEGSYRRPMKGFLNDFLAKFRNIDEVTQQTWRKKFILTCEAINQGVGKSAFRPVRTVNAAVADSVMVGIARRLDCGPITHLKGLKPLLDSLMHDATYKDAIDQRTASEDSVHTRMAQASAIFSEVK